MVTTHPPLPQSVVLFSPPPPPPPPPVVEASACDQFTVGQLRGLFQQFSSVAPSGVMLAESFVQYLFSMASRQVREGWMLTLCMIVTSPCSLEAPSYQSSGVDCPRNRSGPLCSFANSLYLKPSCTSLRLSW